MAGRPRTISDDTILDATERALAAHGPAQLTLAHVSAECGLAPATLVQRFGAKRGLLLALAQRAPIRVEAVFTAAPGGTSPLGRLAAALLQLVPADVTPERLANLLTFSQSELADEAFRAAALERAGAIQAHTATLLREATATGELMRHDPARLAQAVFTTYTGSQLTWCVSGSGALADWLGRDLDLLLLPYRPFGS